MNKFLIYLRFLSHIGIFLSANLITTGCTTVNDDQAFNNSDYKNRINITRLNEEFYSGKYIGHIPGCFPPISARVCRRSEFDVHPYVEVDKLDMKSFEISISVRSGLGKDGTDRTKEILHMVAADIAIQNGYSAFTTLNDIIFYSCSKSVEADSEGEIFNLNPLGHPKKISSTTKAYTTNKCRGSIELKILAFNNKNLLALGIFLKSKSPDNAINYLWPYYDLYRGTAINLPLESSSEIITPEVINVVNYHKDSYKFHYDAINLSRDMHLKYGPSPKKAYQIVDETNSSNESSRVLKKYRTDSN